LQTDHVTSSLSGASSAQLPVTQQGQAVKGLDRGQSGLLFDNISQPLKFSGLLNPIPNETTKAQLGTGGSSTDRAIFDLSGPTGGEPGATLLAWVLTLPEQQTFAKHDGFHIISQSRKDLVQDVKYYPGSENNPLKRNIAYQPNSDNDADNPTSAAADPGPCVYATAECMLVKFQPPGLEANESISFSKRVLSGRDPISNEDLCKAKITYIFSDGYVTTSNFGACAPASLPLIASSWHPDPHVAPHVHRSNLLLARNDGALGCTPVLVPHSNPPQFVCPDVDQTSISDSDVTQEAGQSPRSCDGGATLNNPVTGFILGANVIIQGGQSCRYEGCEFLGSLTINGNATAYLKNCQIDGNLTMNSGKLFILPPDDPATQKPVLVKGNTQIGNPQVSAPNSFVIGPLANINGGLSIQNLPSGGLGYVCKATISGGVTVNNNQSLIQIGEPTTLNNCDGNTISGGLSCKGNSPLPIGGSNKFVTSGFASGDCKGF